MDFQTLIAAFHFGAGESMRVIHFFIIDEHDEVISRTGTLPSWEREESR